MTTKANLALVGEIRTALAALTNPERATKQQAYMKSRLPYFGATAAEVRAVTTQHLRDHPITSRREMEDTVRTLFDEATHREEWYAALGIWTTHKHVQYRTPESVPLLQHVIVTGAWWDVVDDVSTHLLAPLVVSYPDQITRVVRAWSCDDHLWLRRAAVISQVGVKQDLDTDLLSDVLEPNLERPEFFLRKGVGWALRDASKHHPDWVRSYVTDHRSRMRPLSIKEATRRLPSTLKPSPNESSGPHESNCGYRSVISSRCGQDGHPSGHTRAWEAFVTRAVREVVFVDGVRTPFGKAGGMYEQTRADDLAVKVIRDLLRRNPNLPPDRIDEVALAATTQIGDQGLTLGRSAGILAGLPRSVPGYSIDRMCAGAMTAVTTTASGIACDAYRRSDRRRSRTHGTSSDRRGHRSESSIRRRTAG